MIAYSQIRSTLLFNSINLFLLSLVVSVSVAQQQQQQFQQPQHQERQFQQQQQFQQPQQQQQQQPQFQQQPQQQFQQQQENFPLLPPVFIPPNQPVGASPSLQSPVRNLFRNPDSDDNPIASLFNRITRFFSF